MTTGEAKHHNNAAIFIKDASTRWAVAATLRGWLHSEGLPPEKANRIAARICLLLECLADTVVGERGALAREIADDLVGARFTPGVRRLRRVLRDLVQGCAGMGCDERCCNQERVSALYGDAMAVSRALVHFVAERRQLHAVAALSSGRS